MDQLAAAPASIDIQIAKLDYEMAKEDAAERLRFQGEFSQTMFKSLTLVNGGAIVALFTLIGTGAPVVDVADLWVAFICFASGLSLNLASVSAAFFAQAYYMKSSISVAWNKQAEMHGLEPPLVETQQREFKVGNRWEWGAIIAAVASLLAFVAGSGLTLSAMTA